MDFEGEKQVRKRKTICICDHCGVIALEETEYYFGDCFKTLPEGWTRLGKEYLCPKCALKYIVNSERSRGEK